MSENRGRRKTSTLSRAEQAREAQQRFRRRMARLGKFPMQAYVEKGLVKIVDSDAKKKGATRGDRVEWALRKCYGLKGGSK
jgi:hypothetical protein